MATMVLTRTEGSLTTEIPQNGVSIQETLPFTVIAPRGRVYIPSSQRTATRTMTASAPGDPGPPGGSRTITSHVNPKPSPRDDDSGTMTASAPDDPGPPGGSRSITSQIDPKPSPRDDDSGTMTASAPGDPGPPGGSRTITSQVNPKLSPRDDDSGVVVGCCGRCRSGQVNRHRIRRGGKMEWFRKLRNGLREVFCYGGNNEGIEARPKVAGRPGLSIKQT